MGRGVHRSSGVLATSLAALAGWGASTGYDLARAQTAAGPALVSPASQMRLPARNVNVVTVVRRDGVEIISSHSVPAASGLAPGANNDVGALPDDTRRSTDTTAVRLYTHAPTNATLPVGDPGALADDVRGDHRMRANLLNTDGTANLQADNSAHQLVNARRAQIQADLKDALKAFDDRKRNGAGRRELNQLEARIRSDLDQIDILTRSQQSGAD